MRSGGRAWGPSVPSWRAGPGADPVSRRRAHTGGRAAAAHPGTRAVGAAADPVGAAPAQLAAARSRRRIRRWSAPHLVRPRTDGAHPTRPPAAPGTRAGRARGRLVPLRPTRLRFVGGRLAVERPVLAHRRREGCARRDALTGRAGPVADRDRGARGGSHNCAVGGDRRSGGGSADPDRVARPEPARPASTRSRDPCADRHRSLASRGESPGPPVGGARRAHGPP